MLTRPTGFFSHILVESLEDHGVFQIGGRAFPMTIDAAHDAFEEVKKGLASKYGPSVAEGIDTPQLHYWKEVLNAAQWAKFSDGNSEIDISRSVGDSQGRCSIEVNYVTPDLVKQAAQEDPAHKRLMNGL
jgi:hypothetical protein